MGPVKLVLDGMGVQIPQERRHFRGESASDEIYFRMSPLRAVRLPGVCSGSQSFIICIGGHRESRTPRAVAVTAKLFVKELFFQVTVWRIRQCILGPLILPQETKINHCY